MCLSRAHCPAPNSDTSCRWTTFLQERRPTAIRVVDFAFPNIEDRLMIDTCSLGILTIMMIDATPRDSLCLLAGPLSVERIGESCCSSYQVVEAMYRLTLRLDVDIGRGLAVGKCARLLLSRRAVRLWWQLSYSFVVSCPKLR